MKLKKYVIQLAVGVGISFFVMLGRGLLETTTPADAVLAVCDGFTVVALLYLGIGALLWVSTTGIFDIFTYAFRKGAHALLPGRTYEETGSYYDYKMDKAAKRGIKTQYSTLIVGAILLLVSILLTLLWYQIAE